MQSSSASSVSSEPPVEDETPLPALEKVDEDTLRILLSTDNHLGYCERDPVRGLDSFAAFEEVLFLAKHFQCDMVLIAGDLFHDNKPSRRTMYKTMEIIRRYCMGPNPVKIQIVSDQATNFRSVHGSVNYEDEFYSVDLPIFSIHGNHDDPAREGGTEMLAALDLLAVSNLVNYFGRQDEVDKVEVSPVLIRKGNTRVALFGMGSMRDERLNRMWQGKKVRFLRPEEEDWFHIFALHQNRDLGRGTKNCVHESMIPEWMDVVVWGHEHECLIEPAESVVGTFRITQPGSSVATSLTGGESVRKQVGILDVKYNQFRLRPIPLTQVRSFVIGDISLQSKRTPMLDPEDPKIDQKVTTLLEEEVRLLVYEAREKSKELQQDAAAAGNSIAENRDALKYKLEKPDEVLVRLKVEHSGFSTLNNQRFGARFVGEVANPVDVLLFHRRKESSSEGKPGSKKRNAAALLAKPIAPEELEEMHVEDLIKENLELADSKLEILNEQRLGVALEDFVSKEQRQAITEAMAEMLKKQQKKLIARGIASNEDGKDDEGGRDDVIASAAAVRDIVHQESQASKSKPSRAKAVASGKRKRATSMNDDEEDNEEDDGPQEEEEEEGSDDEPVKPKRRAPATAKKPASRGARLATGRAVASSRQKPKDSDDDSLDEPPAPQPSKPGARPRRQTAVRSTVNYSIDESGEESEGSDAVIPGSGEDDDDDLDEDDEEEEVKPKKKVAKVTRTRKPAAKSTRVTKHPVRVPSSGDDDDDDLEDDDEEEEDEKPKKRVASVTRTQKPAAKSTRVTKPSVRGSTLKTKKRKAVYNDDSDDIDDGQRYGSSYGVDDDWGTANTRTAR